MMYPEVAKDVPPGEWVALSLDHTRLIDHDADLTALLARCKSHPTGDLVISKLPDK